MLLSRDGLGLRVVESTSQPIPTATWAYYEIPEVLGVKDLEEKVEKIRAGFGFQRDDRVSTLGQGRASIKRHSRYQPQLEKNCIGKLRKSPVGVPFPGTLSLQTFFTIDEYKL